MEKRSKKLNKPIFSDNVESITPLRIGGNYKKKKKKGSTIISKNKKICYPIIGFTTDKGVLLDLDNVKYKYVLRLAEGFLKGYDLKGYIIIQTSQFNYGIIFDREMSWKEAFGLSCKTAFYFGFRHKGLIKWLILQGIKGAMTLRVSGKGKKEPPKIKKIKGNCEEICRDYLEALKLAQSLNKGKDQDI